MITTPVLPVVGYIHPNGQFRPTKWLKTDEPLVKLSDALAAIAAAQAAQIKDAERLDWLESQCESYGFEDMHEGHL